MTMNTWQRAPDELAVRIGMNELCGVRKPLQVDSRSTAIVYDADGRTTMLEEGTHELDSLLGRLSRLGFGRRGAVLMVDTGRRSIRFLVEGIATRDKQEVNVDVAMSVTVKDPVVFASGMMSQRDALRHHDLADELHPRVALALSLDLPARAASDWVDSRSHHDGLAESIQREIEPELMRRGLDFVIEIISIDLTNPSLEEVETARLNDVELVNELRGLENNIALDDLERRVKERVREHGIRQGETTGKQAHDFEAAQHQADLALETAIANVRRQIARIESESELEASEAAAARDREKRQVQHGAELQELRESLRHVARMAVLRNQSEEQSLEDENGVRMMQQQLRCGELQLGLTRLETEKDQVEHTAHTNKIRQQMALGWEADEHELKMFRERKLVDLDAEQARHLREMERRRLDREYDLEAKRIETDHEKTVARKNAEREAAVRDALDGERSKRDDDQRHAFDTVAGLASQAIRPADTPNENPAANTAPPPPSGRICVACGRAVPEDGKFCAACGNPLTS